MSYMPRPPGPFTQQELDLIWGAARCESPHEYLDDYGAHLAEALRLKYILDVNRKVRRANLERDYPWLRAI